MFRQEVKTNLLPFSADTWATEADFQEHKNILRGSVSTLETGNNGEPILSSGSENLPPKDPKQHLKGTIINDQSDYQKAQEDSSKHEREI